MGLHECASRVFVVGNGRQRSLGLIDDVEPQPEPGLGCPQCPAEPASKRIDVTDDVFGPGMIREWKWDLGSTAVE